MESSKILSAAFYDRQVLAVAADLMGKMLVREVNGQRISGLICETEAYDGSQDRACHARTGKTQRNAAMFGPAGCAYVYFTYGMHWCMNAVTGPVGYGAAVLLRAIFPVEGKAIIRQHRGAVKEKDWTNGPAKLTKALMVDKAFDGLPLYEKASALWIEEGISVSKHLIQTGPRIGIQNTPEPWRTKPWRFWVASAVMAALVKEQGLA